MVRKDLLVTAYAGLALGFAVLTAVTELHRRYVTRQVVRDAERLLLRGSS